MGRKNRKSKGRRNNQNNNRGSNQSQNRNGKPNSNNTNNGKTIEKSNVHKPLSEPTRDEPKIIAAQKGLGAMETEKIDDEEKPRLNRLPDSPGLKELIMKDDIEKSWHALKRLWKKAEEVQKKYEDLKGELEKREEKIQKEEARQKAQAKVYEDLGGKERRLILQKVDLDKREADAKAGFPELLEAKYQELEGEKAKVKQAEKELEDRKQELVAEVKKKQVELEQQYDEKFIKTLDELREKEDALEKERKGLRKEVRKLKAMEEILKEEREDFADRKEEYLTTEIQKARLEIKALGEQKEGFKEMVEERGQKIKELKLLFHGFGNRPPEEVKKDLDDMRNKIKDLQTELASMLPADEKIRLEELEKKCGEIETERRELLARSIQLENKNKRLQQGVAEIEDMKETVQVMESRIRIKETRIKELQVEVDDFTAQAENKKVFEYCSKMDENKALQNPSPQEEQFQNLKELVTYLKHRIATVEEPNLYYSDQVIRQFLGGLAIGQLTLLEGDSGTGKTSLPRAFAKAISGSRRNFDREMEQFKVIEVQSGWRDRQDLMGFFNTFEKKYYESDFLKALYKASTPRFRDRPFFIILDEMNLSHPEHYFADVLSQIEQTRGEGELKIIASAASYPSHFNERSDSLTLSLPPNVWFIGTANHDETTMQFAPKTYDRANVMKMERNQADFALEEVKPRQLSFQNLKGLFEEAQANNESDKGVIWAKDMLFNKVDPLTRKFGIHIGNRLENQLTRFLPVFSATGGTKEEAVDFILSAKVLRKIRNRHEIREEQYTRLKTDLQELLEDKVPLSLGLLDKEIMRSGGGYG